VADLLLMSSQVGREKEGVVVIWLLSLVVVARMLVCNRENRYRLEAIVQHGSRRIWVSKTATKELFLR
jgi:hypothetical protein